MASLAFDVEVSDENSLWAEIETMAQRCLDLSNIPTSGQGSDLPAFDGRRRAQSGPSRRCVRLLLDAQLPVRLGRLLTAAGHDVVHSSKLPDGNRTTDGALTAFADREERVMVTKGRDFEISHLLSRRPARLLLVTTGNIANSDLLRLFETNMVIIDRRSPLPATSRSRG